MSKAVVFRTPGLMPIEAFTMVGVNSKPNTTNPIGFFGTGLKYAIAVLLRTNQKVTIFIGRTEYVFQVEQEDFRGKEFGFVYMRKREGVLSKWRKTKLPFTLEYGKTWELWQAYRELHTNTLDENGTISLHDEESAPEAAAGETLIVVEGQEFLQEYYDRNKTFLSAELRERQTDFSASIQVFEKASRHIYFRGMRVLDLPKDVSSKYTYNFLGHVSLTEDRTAAYPFVIEARIAEMVATSKDKEFIRGVIQSPIGSFEQGLSFRHAETPPSEEFKQVSRMAYARHHGAFTYARSYTPAESPTYGLRSIVQAFVDLPDKPAGLEAMVDDAKKYLDGTYEGLD